MKRGCQGGLGREQHVSGYSRVLGGHVRCAKGRQGDTAAGQAKGSDGQVVALKASIEDLTVGGVTHSLLLLPWLLCAGPQCQACEAAFQVGVGTLRVEVWPVRKLQCSPGKHQVQTGRCYTQNEVKRGDTFGSL